MTPNMITLTPRRQSTSTCAFKVQKITALPAWELFEWVSNATIRKIFGIIGALHTMVRQSKICQAFSMMGYSRAVVGNVRKRLALDLGREFTYRRIFSWQRATELKWCLIMSLSCFYSWLE